MLKTVVIFSLLLTGSIAQSEPSALYSIEKYQPEDKLDITAPRWRNEGDDLFAEVNGRKYLITQEDWEPFTHKSIEAVRDLDGDGLSEAIISLSQGGNCCGPRFAIVSNRGDGFFSVSEHEELSGWPVIEIIEQDNQPLILVHNYEEGIDNTSIKETRSIFRFENGKLVLISKISNAALLYAKQEIDSSDLQTDTNNNGNQIIQAMIDKDDVLDTLECEYWDRWGSLNCHINSSLHGKGIDAPSCDRVGVLSTKTNGMSDLVCNRRGVFVFDGKGYNRLEN